MTTEDAPKGGVTPTQLIAMLDNMHEVGFCEKRTQKGRQVYILSVDDICECDDILAGYYLKE